MGSFIVTFSFFLLLFLCRPFFSLANLHKSKNLLKENLLCQLSSTATSNGDSPTDYFEVNKPIKLPKTKPCSYLALLHDFGFTYGRPPIVVNYTPPPHCYSHSKNLAKIVLEWKASCIGTQFDRIFGVWLGGVELLRSCTAEPTSKGIVWIVEKDVTRYSSLLLNKEKQNLAVYLGNIVDNTYTGVYHANLTFHYFPAEKMQSLNNYASSFYSSSRADLILPISRNLPLTDGLWFEVQHSNDTKLKQFKIPQNVYRAVLEVYISFHENDEFWYGNYPNDYIAANNLSGVPGNGPFREVVVSVDGVVVGAIWPFTVIYTGGINPQFWSPITGIASFNLPSYDIEITPFLGNILDGNSHSLGFTVTNALNVWFIDANLHLWLDHKSVKTEGKLVDCNNKAVSVYYKSDFHGLNGKFFTTANRFISSTGWIKSSFGNITTHSIQDFSYNNSLEIRNDGNSQAINQITHFNDGVYTKMPFPFVVAEESFKTFLLNLYMDLTNQGEGAFFYVTNVSLGFNEIIKYQTAGFDFFTSSLQNMQDAQAVLAVKDFLIIERLQGTRQVYDYRGSDFCYSRTISSSNAIIDYDEVSDLCDNRSNATLRFSSSSQ